MYYIHRKDHIKTNLVNKNFKEIAQKCNHINSFSQHQHYTPCSSRVLFNTMILNTIGSKIIINENLKNFTILKLMGGCNIKRE